MNRVNENQKQFVYKSSKMISNCQFKNKRKNNDF